MLSRDPRRAEAARDRVAVVATQTALVFIATDLSSQDAVRTLAKQRHSRLTRLDVLINNAASASNRRELTVDGIESTLATNHLAPFLLTHLVLDLLGAAPAGRVVTVTSQDHSNKLDFDNLQAERHYNFFDAYARSKLANILFTYELARRLQGSTITANCFTPPWTKTGFGRGAGGMLGFMYVMIGIMALTPLVRRADEGAGTGVYLASSPDVAGVSGQCFTRLRPASSNRSRTTPAWRRGSGASAKS
jgi:NAD(P)-dependent dehydrogenase (short-subunit alcohol dehydrogenase family)